MGLTVLLEGIDITPTVDEYSIQISDVLGQGAGVGSASTGRAATCQFITTLGPAASAIGAGTQLTSAKLVRMGELQIYDATGACIFGGFAAKLEDKTDRTTTYTQIDGYDYWQQLDRIQVQQLYSGASDIYIINDLLKRYAPWIDRSALPIFGAYSFTVQNFKAISLQKALSKITDVTGYQIWVTPDKKIHYTSPLQSSTAPFKLSDTPDFQTSYPLGIDTYVVDDTAAINRAIFYGGKRPSNDFTQDLSSQANGTNNLFVLAYYPRTASDGKIHIKVNGGVDLVLGYLLGTGPENAFKSAGGYCDVLLNADAHTLTFDAPPAAGSIVSCTYRYEYPMVIQLVDQASFSYYGAWYDGVISDDTVFDTAVAVGRCRTLLNEQSHGLVSLTCHCYRAGLQSGQILHVNHSIRGINNSFVIQQVDTKPLGNGLFEYDITAGAWNWNLVDAIMSTLHATQKAGIDVNVDNNGQSTTGVDIQQVNHTAKPALTGSVKTFTPGQFYARSTPANDGHDAYPGLFTITS